MNLSTRNENLKHLGKKHPTPIDSFLWPFRRFLGWESASGVLLIFSTILALTWANSPWKEAYHHLWHIHISFGIGPFIINKQLHHWINDGLMSIFFFTVGLEIKRELLAGELASLKKSALPIAGAIGGMVAPAAIYAFFNFHSEGAHGWGVPMATDIAFVIGILSLLGKRVPLSLKVFITALAIVDDIGAVLVIAVFYSSKLSLTMLFLGSALLGLSFLFNRLGVRHWIAYAIIGAILWAAFLKSGVHATIAGVLLAFTIPVRSKLNFHQFIEDMGANLNFFKSHTDSEVDIRPSQHILISNKQQLAASDNMEKLVEGIQPPMQRLEHILLPWVNFFIMPLFAIANAGVTIESDIWSALKHPVSIGIIFGLVFGKQIGITLCAWITVKLGLAELPRRTTWKQLYLVSWLGGVGFTMALFIAALAFGEGSLSPISKIGVLVASLIAGVVGFALIYLTEKEEREDA